jgi:hypothetical protein
VGATFTEVIRCLRVEITVATQMRKNYIHSGYAVLQSRCQTYTHRNHIVGVRPTSMEATQCPTAEMKSTCTVTTIKK